MTITVMDTPIRTNLKIILILEKIKIYLMQEAVLGTPVVLPFKFPCKEAQRI
jgi:hypothetical protein